MVFVKSESVDSMKKNFGILLSSYTKAINKHYKRHGNLFQSLTRSRWIDDDGYLMTILAYIHQNPLRSGLVARLEDWEYSSYRDYIGTRRELLVKKDYVTRLFTSLEDFQQFSETLLPSVERRYWV